MPWWSSETGPGKLEWVSGPYFPFLFDQVLSWTACCVWVYSCLNCPSVLCGCVQSWTTTKHTVDLFAWAWQGSTSTPMPLWPSSWATPGYRDDVVQVESSNRCSSFKQHLYLSSCISSCTPNRSEQSLHCWALRSVPGTSGLSQPHHGQRSVLKNQCDVDTLQPRFWSEVWRADLLSALSDTEWPGRNQTLKHGTLTYFLDGAHTMRSMQACVDWFAEAAAQHERNGRWTSPHLLRSGPFTLVHQIRC